MDRTDPSGQCEETKANGCYTSTGTHIAQAYSRPNTDGGGTFVGGGGGFGGAGASGRFEPQQQSAGANSPTTSSNAGTASGGSPANTDSKTNTSSATGGTATAAAAAGAAAAPRVWSAGLNGGSNSVFYSGTQYGARSYAEGLGGTTLADTPIGGMLDSVSTALGSPRFMTPVFNAASRTFAMNATGTATAVIFANGPTWTGIELPALISRGIPIAFIVP